MAGEADMMDYALMAFEASDFGGTAQYGETPIPCSPGTLGIGGRFVAGGISPNAEMTVVIRKSAYSGTPAFAVGKPITITTGNSEVKALKIADDGIRDCIYAWELTCDDLNQNA